MHVRIQSLGIIRKSKWSDYMYMHRIVVHLFAWMHVFVMLRVRVEGDILPYT